MHPRLWESTDQVRRMVLVLRKNDVRNPDIIAGLRKRVTRDDPLAFALVYLPKHLQLDDGTISLSDIHAEWLRFAESWDRPKEQNPRDIFVAPRGTGKTTWFFLILPMWAAATGRVKFIAAFADSSTQAEIHLSTFKAELDRNLRLRQDYPELCSPAKRPSGTSVSDTQALLYTKSHFAFAARGADGGTLGLKIGDQRPDLLLCDDIEPGESQYSAYQVGKRLSTLIDVVLPMGSANARTVLAGTTTMNGSIIHQAVMHEKEPADWIKDEGFEVHHSLPFNDAGDSVWPERWPTDWLHGQERLRSFAKNFLNQPLPIDSEYWTPEDYSYGTLPTVSKRIIAVDTAVTTKRTSDETGIAVVSYSGAARQACVDHIQGVRLKGEPLRTLLMDLVVRFPDTAYVLWERNQGGDSLPTSVLHDFPIPVHTVHQTEKKELRIERALSYYRRGKVLHAASFTRLETQQMEFPHGLHDDLADAVSLAVDHFAGVGRPASKGKLQSTTR